MSKAKELRLDCRCPSSTRAARGRRARRKVNLLTLKETKSVLSGPRGAASRPQSQYAAVPDEEVGDRACRNWERAANRMRVMPERELQERQR